MGTHVFPLPPKTPIISTWTHGVGPACHSLWVATRTIRTPCHSEWGCVCFFRKLDSPMSLACPCPAASSHPPPMSHVRPAQPSPYAPARDHHRMPMPAVIPRHVPSSPLPSPHLPAGFALLYPIPVRPVVSLYCLHVPTRASIFVSGLSPTLILYILTLPVHAPRPWVVRHMSPPSG